MKVLLALVLGVILFLFSHLITAKTSYENGRASGQQEILRYWAEEEAQFHKEYPKGFCK